MQNLVNGSKAASRLQRKLFSIFCLLLNFLREVSPATSQNIENPGGMDGYAAEQELQQQHHVNGSTMPMSGSQQQMAHERRRQSSIHKQASIEVSSWEFFFTKISRKD
jgi:hypothetical protein